MIIHKVAAAATLMFVLLGSAHAGDAIAVPGSFSIVGEFSKDGSAGIFGSKNSWKGFAPLQAVISAAPSGEWVIAAAADLSITMDSKSFYQYRAGFGTPVAQNLKFSSSRQDADLKQGARWTGNMDADMPPASWCQEPHSLVTSNFEIEAAETYELSVDGKPLSITVLPVVERGTWNRCYTGKRYTRTLYSPELAIPVSIEHFGFTPAGQVHPSSYRINVKEVRRN